MITVYYYSYYFSNNQTLFQTIPLITSYILILPLSIILRPLTYPPPTRPTHRPRTFLMRPHHLQAKYDQNRAKLREKTLPYVRSEAALDKHAGMNNGYVVHAMPVPPPGAYHKGQLLTSSRILTSLRCSSRTLLRHRTHTPPYDLFPCPT